MSTGHSINPLLSTPRISIAFLTWWLMRVPRTQRESAALTLVPFLYRCLMGGERPPLREVEHIKLTFGACRARQSLAAAVCLCNRLEAVR